LAQLLKEAAEQIVAIRARTLAIGLASQCHQLGEQQLAEDVFTFAIAGTPDAERVHTTLAATAYLLATGQPARADAVFRPLLDDERCRKDPAFWRLGSVLAKNHGMVAQAARCLDEAIDIDYRDLPDVVNLQTVRAVFGELLNLYQQLAESIGPPDGAGREEFVSRVVRAADRWRSLDADDAAACQSAARILWRLRAKDLAWEYLTTPLALRSDAPDWLGIIQTMKGLGELELAAQACQSAFQADPTNAQILWDHAQLLEQLGRQGANELRRQILEGRWDAKCESLRLEARKRLEDPPK
jgi:tetratricopeptide (TPR) repeat protein